MPNGALFIPIMSDRISLVKRKDKANRFASVSSIHKEDAMKDEANIVEQYADSDVGERIDILIKYYPNFIHLVEGFERNLSFIIKQEKEMKRRSAVGELGVRVQTSHLSDPTAREAIDNIMIEQAIKNGDLSEIIAELDEDLQREHETEIPTMKSLDK